MTTRAELSILDQYFGTGGYPIPHVSPTVEEGLKWTDTRRQWIWLRDLYNQQHTTIDSLNRRLTSMGQELVEQREATIANRMAFAEETRQRQYRCRRRLHPLLNRILKPAGGN